MPTSTKLNTCFPKQTSSGTVYDYFLYELALHEAGYAFGLSNAVSPPGVYISLIPSEARRISHPEIKQTVMNYSEQESVIEPDCSLYPFDVMAIHALYQNVP